MSHSIGVVRKLRRFFMLQGLYAVISRNEQKCVLFTGMQVNAMLYMYTHIRGESALLISLHLNGIICMWLVHSINSVVQKHQSRQAHIAYPRDYSKYLDGQIGDIHDIKMYQFIKYSKCRIVASCEVYTSIDFSKALTRIPVLKLVIHLLIFSLCRNMHLQLAYFWAANRRRVKSRLCWNHSEFTVISRKCVQIPSVE